MAEKTCFKCGCTKPVADFYPHKGMADGRLNKCIPCTKKDERDRRAANPEKYRAYDRARASLPHRAAARQAYQSTLSGALVARAAKKRYEENNPHKKKATTAVNNAKRRGKVEQLPCWVCGNEDSEAHHYAYDMPTDVVWLCSQHHSQLHREFRDYLREKRIKDES